MYMYMYTCRWCRYSFLHFFDKHGLWVGEDNTIDATERGSRVEEVDPQVSVVSLLTLTDVLEGERERSKVRVLAHVHKKIQ